MGNSWQKKEPPRGKSVGYTERDLITSESSTSNVWWIIAVHNYESEHKRIWEHNYKCRRDETVAEREEEGVVQGREAKRTFVPYRLGRLEKVSIKPIPPLGLMWLDVSLTLQDAYLDAGY